MAECIYCGADCDNLHHGLCCNCYSKSWMKQTFDKDFVMGDFCKSCLAMQHPDMIEYVHQMKSGTAGDIHGKL